MRLFVLTALVLVAFASNSVLNRIAVADGAMGSTSFVGIRILSGAVMLSILMLARRRAVAPLLTRSRLWGAGWLALYALGNSFAFERLEAGAGSLILFGGVQLTMFGGALYLGERIPRQRWFGAAIAFAGLAWLMWPSGASAPNLTGALIMVVAAFAWGIYSLLGRGARDPMGETAINFILAAAITGVVMVLRPDGISTLGIICAVLSGAIASGLGYSLWYAVLPKIPAALAAVAQLTVPVLAALGGVLTLGEPITWRFVIATAVVLGGLALSSLRARSPRADRNAPARQD
ncbi:DMT family transporter [Candidatus Halocynthiibacter alkanivorans]|uniref:DMT family transporter n=1 Tax=Candidatus Halocynthiibacter alkanivorans TaxID=2267619 RepID=UPI000DF2F605|nr:DMT family transporter [Candidatus Halocynthiibacter alkanivorans]